MSLHTQYLLFSHAVALMHKAMKEKKEQCLSVERQFQADRRTQTSK